MVTQTQALQLVQALARSPPFCTHLVHLWIDYPPLVKGQNPDFK